MIVKAYAKINLFLDILGKLDSGYHSLFMLNQSVGLFDEITVEKKESGITLTCYDKSIPEGSSNLAYKAAKAFFESTGTDGGADIKIEKQIPAQAGLAGGSADAAGVLTALREIYKPGLTVPQLCRIGLTVGSDIPFCIMGGTCLVQNTGGIISPLVPLADCAIVLAKPDRGVSTKEAYEQADSVRLWHPDRNRMLDSCERGDFEGTCKYAGNVFEQVIEVPERVEIKRIMRENGCSLCQMSGSGPTVFGLFLNRENAENAAEQIKKICGKVFITSPVDRGTETV